MTTTQTTDRGAYLQTVTATFRVLFEGEHELFQNTDTEELRQRARDRVVELLPPILNEALDEAYANRGAGREHRYFWPASHFPEGIGAHDIPPDRGVLREPLDRSEPEAEDIIAVGLVDLLGDGNEIDDEIMEKARSIEASLRIAGFLR